MARNIVICCDGTNNQFGRETTNVVRLVQVLEHDSTRQLVHYDPGIGTLPEPGIFTGIAKRLSEWFELAFATDLPRKVQAIYTYLMDTWEPGDQVFLFGFSRGAYSVRVLAGLLHHLGLLPRGGDNMVPYVWRLFKSVRGRAQQAGTRDASYWGVCDQFRSTFARRVPGDDARRFRVHFLGLWDTVSSVGWAWDPATFPFTAHNPSVDSVRHAVSIDERRWFFRQNLMDAVAGQDVEERWFAGVHSDVGGGYSESDKQLWRIPFEWVAREAIKAGIAVDESRLTGVLPPTSRNVWADEQHESLTLKWYPAELVPKLTWRPRLKMRLPDIGRWRRRFVHDGALIDEATLRRIRGTRYAPPNLPATFLSTVRALPDVTGPIPVKS